MGRHVWGWLGLLMLRNVMASLVWDFGTDVRGSSVIAQNKGKIQLWEKSVQITIAVPTCMEVSYVRVEVFNHISTPVVTFNKHTHTVLIEYMLLQISHSYYDIVAKGKRSPQCGGGGVGGRRPPRFPSGGGGGGGNRPPRNRFPPGGGGGGGNRPPKNRVPPGGGEGGVNKPPNNYPNPIGSEKNHQHPSHPGDNKNPSSTGDNDHNDVEIDVDSIDVNNG